MEKKVGDYLSPRELDEAYLYIAEQLLYMSEAKEKTIRFMMGEDNYEEAKNWQALSAEINAIAEHSKAISEDDLEEFEGKAFEAFMEALFTATECDDSLLNARKKTETFITLVYPGESLQSLWEAFHNKEDSKAQEIAITMFKDYGKPIGQVLYETIAEDMNSHFLSEYYRQTTGISKIGGIRATHTSLYIERTDIPSTASEKYGRPGFEKDAYIDLEDGKIILNNEEVTRREQLYDTLEVISVLPNIITQLEKELPS